MLQKIFISLGTNKGIRLQNLQTAIDLLYQQVGNIIAISPVYETSSWGFDSEDFLNCCVTLTTKLSPNDLLKSFQQMERSLGRKEKIGNAYQARVIDIDILFYEDQIIDQRHLQVPHSAMTSRKFVLAPLADIAPDFCHPKLQTTISKLLNACTDTSNITLYPETLKNPFELNKFSKYQFITIEGNIGCGKTSLATMIAEDFNLQTVLERFEENAFLPKFYKDPSRYAFPLEMSFLADRQQQLAAGISSIEGSKANIIADYHISKSLIFAKITLSKEEFNLYQQFYKLLNAQLQMPSIYVYLHQNTASLLHNIKKRGRAYEQQIQSDYLEKINKSYTDYIEAQSNLNLKIIDVSNLDFVNNRADYLQLLQQFLA